MPATLAKTIRVADSYALGDPMHPLFELAEPSRRFPARGPGPARRDDRQDFGVKRGPDYRYDVNQVAAVEQDRPDAGSSQRQKMDGPAWGQNRVGEKPWEAPALTYEQMMDGPCTYHTRDPRRPSSHTTRSCSWYGRMRKEAIEAWFGGNPGVGFRGNPVNPAPMRPPTLPLPGQTLFP